MKSLFLILFLYLPLSGVAQTKDLTGTTWHMISEGIDIKPKYITFHPDGVFEDTYVAIEHGENYTWSQKGKKVVLRYNDNYSVHRGVIKGNVITGKTKNKAGEKWTWTATLIN